MSVGLLCPSCDAESVATVGGLAGHLAMTHGLGSGEALRRAREVEADGALRGGAEKAGDVATERKCSGCGEVGHRANKCPKGGAATASDSKPCSYCKCAGGHSDKCPRGSGKPAVRAVKAASATNGNGHVRQWLDAEIVSLKGEIAYLERLRARA